MMTDGRIHGIQIWTGPGTARPPERPLPGAVVWNLTTGVASDTAQALLNTGLDPSVESTDRRTFAADMPVNQLIPDESKVLALALSCKPGDTLSSTWDLISQSGEPIRVSFVARAISEPGAAGTTHLVSRAMNWRGKTEIAPPSGHDLATSILNGMAQPGVHRALIDLGKWNLLKWLDPPCPHCDWRRQDPDRPLVHPSDRPVLRAMADKFVTGPVAAVLRMRAASDGWALLHVTVCQVELQPGTHVGLVAIRLPTPAELATG